MAEKSEEVKAEEAKKAEEAAKAAEESKKAEEEAEKSKAAEAAAEAEKAKEAEVHYEVQHHLGASPSGVLYVKGDIVPAHKLGDYQAVERLLSLAAVKRAQKVVAY